MLNVIDYARPMIMHLQLPKICYQNIVCIIVSVTKENKCVYIFGGKLYMLGKNQINSINQW